jgi:hypothetical protein
MPARIPDGYDAAMDHFRKAIDAINPPASDAVAWNLSTGLWHLALTIQRDMGELTKRLDAIDSNVIGMR